MIIGPGGDFVFVNEYVAVGHERASMRPAILARHKGVAMEFLDVAVSRYRVA
jgi:hypothetical protein